jgi:hypothetical protein
MHAVSVLGDADGHRPDVPAIGCLPMLLGVKAADPHQIHPVEPVRLGSRSSGESVRRETSSARRRLRRAQQVRFREHFLPGLRAPDQGFGGHMQPKMRPVHGPIQQWSDV